MVTMEMLLCSNGIGAGGANLGVLLACHAIENFGRRCCPEIESNCREIGRRMYAGVKKGPKFVNPHRGLAWLKVAI
jgi:hypothetical protein